MLILMKAKTAMIAGALAAPILATTFAPAPDDHIDGVHLASVSFSYRAAGDFSAGGKPVAGPLREHRLTTDLVIMDHLVTSDEYARCVQDGECPRVAASDSAPNVPVVGVNWHDASSYAAWISRKTGITHRLPTDEEWTLAAGEKASDEAPPLVDPSDPAQAWIARYEAESARSRPNEAAPQPTGTFGTNSKGLKDVAANVWEWTESCFVRATLDDGRERVTNTNCGVRVVEGSHRAYMTDFIRDPKTGGCAQGAPPTNLGFRLVIVRPASMVAPIGRTVAKLLRLI